MQRGTQVHPEGKAVVQKGYREILKEEIKKCVAKKLKRMAAGADEIFISKYIC